MLPLLRYSAFKMNITPPSPVLLAIMVRLLPLVMALAGFAGCSVPGEDAERSAADRAGKPFQIPHAERELPILPEEAALDEVIRYAFLSNASIERAFYEWRSAIERIPQAGSWEDPRFSFGVLFPKDRMSRWDRTTLGLSQLLPFPGKLDAAGRASLEGAVAAGRRFEDARFALQADVVEAWQSLALADRSIASAERHLRLLRESVQIARTLVETGKAKQAELTRMELERDLGENALKSLEAERPPALARLNALLSRAPKLPLRPKAPAPPRRLETGDDALIALVAERNPELQAMAAEVRGREAALDLARRSWLPDLEISLSIQGTVERMIEGMFSLPFQIGRVRARIDEASADVRAVQAASRQRLDDLRAQVVLQIMLARNGGRQAELFRDRLLPKAREIVETVKASYGAGTSSYLELVDAQRALIDLELEQARMEALRDSAVARVEALCALDFGGVK